MFTFSVSDRLTICLFLALPMFLEIQLPVTVFGLDGLDG
ncbi:hypothetical protein Z949_2364 [Sulfitobacter guttiformis KCTC 32187]|nr:hypothetical protein Z949_2364 [Sulfitobacter guttiformis KCTC 32187]